MTDCVDHLASFLATHEQKGSATSPTAIEEEHILILLKSIYDATPIGPIPTLITDGFDEDQIWEEIELRNNTVLDELPIWRS